MFYGNWMTSVVFVNFKALSLSLKPYTVLSLSEETFSTEVVQPCILSSVEETLLRNPKSQT